MSPAGILVMSRFVPVLFLTVLACGGEPRGTPACGIAALAAPTLLLDQFRVEGRVLSVAPDFPPAVLPVRISAGPALRGVVSNPGTGWIVGVDGPLPPGPPPGFGVLVVDRIEGPRGVVLYEGQPIRGAPVIGQVATSRASIPLIGLEIPFAEFDQVACPFFPDSLRR